MRAARLRSALACAATAALLAFPAIAVAQAKIHVCPQPDGTVRYQDRPCAETARTARPQAATDDPAATSEPGRAAAPAAAPTGPVAPTRPVAPPRVAGPASEPAASRADYLELNAARCRDGNRRACAAVTCERSGDLASRECQAAVGWVSGRGWRARPRGDLFAPDVEADEYELRCADGRNTRFLLVREGGAAAAGARPSGARPRVLAGDLERFARGVCTG